MEIKEDLLVKGNTKVVGNVGIGMETPSQKLTLGSGNVLLPNTNLDIDGNLFFGGVTNIGQTGMRLFGGNVNKCIPAGFIDVRTTDPHDGLRIRVDTMRADAERMRITAEGNVGIGTSNPQARLDIQGGGLNIGGAGILPHLDAAIHVKSSYGGFDRLLQMSPEGASKPGLNLLASKNKDNGEQWWVWGVDIDNRWRIQPGTSFSGAIGLFIDPSGNVGIGTTNPQARLDVAGDIRVTGDVKLVGGDCAEDFDVVDAESVQPGTVMVIDREGVLRPSEHAYDKRVAGVVSGAGDLHPGITLDKHNEKTNRLPLALTGKVYCKVDAQYGPVDVGDLLTTSPTYGHAMKAADPGRAFGTVIGKALRELTEGKGMIPILVALQ